MQITKAFAGNVPHVYVTFECASYIRRTCSYGLKRNLLIILKSEMKIRISEEDMNLYYPQSLMELLWRIRAPVRVAAFCRLAAQRLGDVTIKETEERGRYCIHIPSESKICP